MNKKGIEKIDVLQIISKIFDNQYMEYNKMKMSIKPYNRSSFQNIKCEKKLALLEVIKFKTVIDILYYNKLDRLYFSSDYTNELIASMEHKACNIIKIYNLNYNFDDISPFKSTLNNPNGNLYENFIGDYIIGIKNKCRDKRRIKEYVVKKKHFEIIDDPNLSLYFKKEDNY